MVRALLRGVVPSEQLTEEMEVAARRRNRRGAPRFKPTSDPEQPQGDRISSLPDTILGEIISLLPTNDGARTQTFAPRWRHIWRSAPINLDHKDLPVDEQAKVSLISQIIARHQGPVRRLCVSALYLENCRTTVSTCLRSPALDGLQELEFDQGEAKLSPYPLLPSSAFRFGATLRVATISKCHIILRMVEMAHFPQLKQLGLESVMISNDSLHNIIIRCPVLECLLLKRSYGFDSISINSSTLESIGLGISYKTVKLVIEDAPQLKRLLQLERSIAMDVSVISAPKLDTLGCLSDRDCYSKLAVGNTIIQGLRAVSFTAMVCSVKTLAIIIYNIRVDTVINLMRCFPCLQKLYIQTSSVSGDSNWRHSKYHDAIRCLDTSLKAIIFQNYQATESQINLVEFLILNTRILETMKFQSRAKNRKKTITERKRLLQLEKRASMGARFRFKICSCDYPPHIKHVDDLMKADPFECTC